MSFVRSIACSAGLFAIWSQLSFGQSQLANGSIVVTVTDSAGAVMAGVPVQLVNKGNGFSRSVVTNDQGRATGPLLPLGTYDVTAQQPGFAAVKVADVVLQVGEQRLLTISMKLSAVNETVTVSGGEADLVEAERSNSAARINDRAVHNLPILARNFQTFMLLTPGTLIKDRTGTDANFSGSEQECEQLS